MNTHHYTIDLNWTGNLGEGTTGYKDYERSYDISCPGKPILNGSSDPAFLGDREKYNPEEFLLMAVSSCHMLWYLHLCAVAGIVVTAYSDKATATLEINNEGIGKIKSVILYPQIIISDESKIEMANYLNQEANKYCFIANSCNFKIEHKPEISILKK